MTNLNVNVHIFNYGNCGNITGVEIQFKFYLVFDFVLCD